VTSADWQNSETKVAERKTQDGGDIVMSGSATTVRWLLRETFETGVLCVSYAAAS